MHDSIYNSIWAGGDLPGARSALVVLYSTGDPIHYCTLHYTTPHYTLLPGTRLAVVLEEMAGGAEVGRRPIEGERLHSIV